MGLTSVLRTARLSWLLCVAILATWLLVAIALDQSVLAAQHSRQLLQFGAANGPLLQAGEWWRLLVSQLLHVHAPHMLFNALAILVVGALVEAAAGRRWLVATCVFGGCVGQFASVACYPGLVSSGASQALMALCGTALVMCRTSRAYMLVVSIVAVQLALDVRAAGMVKAGHGWGFAAGILVGGLAMLVFRRRVTVHA